MYSFIFTYNDPFTGTGLRKTDFREARKKGSKESGSSYLQKSPAGLLRVNHDLGFKDQ